jgi:hypothetical protein
MLRSNLNELIVDQAVIKTKAAIADRDGVAVCEVEEARERRNKKEG